MICFSQHTPVSLAFTLHVHISCVLMSSVSSSHWSIIKISAIMCQLEPHLWMCKFVLIRYLVLLNVINTLSVQLIHFSCLTPSLSVGGGMLWFPPTTFTYLHEFVHTYLHSHICPNYFYIMWLLPVVSTRVWMPIAIWHCGMPRQPSVIARSLNHCSQYVRVCPCHCLAHVWLLVVPYVSLVHSSLFLVFGLSIFFFLFAKM